MRIRSRRSLRRRGLGGRPSDQRQRRRRIRGPLPRRPPKPWRPPPFWEGAGSETGSSGAVVGAGWRSEARRRREGRSGWGALTGRDGGRPVRPCVGLRREGPFARPSSVRAGPFSVWRHGAASGSARSGRVQSAARLGVSTGGRSTTRPLGLAADAFELGADRRSAAPLARPLRRWPFPSGSAGPSAPAAPSESGPREPGPTGAPVLPLSVFNLSCLRISSSSRMRSTVATGPESARCVRPPASLGDAAAKVPKKTGAV